MKITQAQSIDYDQVLFEAAPELLELAATTLAEWHAKDSNVLSKEPGRIKAIRKSSAYEIIRQAAIAKARP